MTDQPQTPEPENAAPAQPEVRPAQPAAAAPPAEYAKPSAPSPVAWPPPRAPEDESSDGAGTSAADRPEIAIAGAFAGGFLLAMILKRLAR